MIRTTMITSSSSFSSPLNFQDNPSQVIMSSSSFTSDEVAGEGQGYADGGKEPTASVGSSILGSTEASIREVEEADIVLEIEAARGWTDSAPPPSVNGYGWASHEVGLVNNSSYKEFKTIIFKVSIKEEGRSSFYLDDGQPKFPFYWTEHPKKVVSRAKSSMTPEELEIVSLLDQLPRKTSSRAPIGLLSSNSLCSRVFDTSKAPRSVNPAFKIAPYSSPPTTPSTVQVEDEVSLQRGGKRKVVKDKSVCSSKKKKRKVPEGPLMAGPFDSTVHLADRLEYRLDPEENKLLHGMTTGEVVDLAYELNVRSNLCLAYAAGSAKSIIAEELEVARLDLEKAKKSNEDLTRRVEELQKMAEDERQKASVILAKARNAARQLQKVNDDLKSDLQKSAIQITDLTRERDALAATQAKMTVENKALGDDVCNERFRGFEQGIAQCHYFFKVPLDFPDFDIMKDVVNGELIALSLPETEGMPPNEIIPPNAPAEVGESAHASV
ncbi:hypothetical protein LR48_Vigan04g152500 [Vigna angularis]|uniref:Uncharacterized protein n=1 Tax=Phaseolus angularis TaxID=3914 RepID=A0A0L9UFG8_PHAAN|nr:hypothetical protein LR48_Vigan04g152500 [Vigna angularis]